MSYDIGEQVQSNPQGGVYVLREASVVLEVRCCFPHKSFKERLGSASRALSLCPFDDFTLGKICALRKMLDPALALSKDQLYHLSAYLQNAVAEAFVQSHCGEKACSALRDYLLQLD